MSQQELADRINDQVGAVGVPGIGVTANAISRWERGIVMPGPFYRRALAQYFGITVPELGLALVREQNDRPPAPVHPADRRPAAENDVDPDPRVARSQDHWRQTRRALNAQRPALTQLAATVYEPHLRTLDAGLLAHPDWLPAEPVDLDSIELVYQPDAAPPELDGAGPESAHVRPRASLVRRYQRYAQAIRDLDHPRLFENRFSWRLTTLDWLSGAGRMTFAPTTYFAAVDMYEAVAHEMAYVHLTENGSVGPGRPVKRNLPLRKLIGDPFDLGRRTVLPSIDTLTIRRDGADASFVLHQRDARSVAVAGGMLQVIPSGVFQPSSVLPGSLETDFSLWRNMMREYSEELLGNAEHDGDGAPVRYGDEPFAWFDRARRDGRIRVWCLGVAVDALTLVGEILTVAVFDADTFDELAKDIVDVNDEGSIVNIRVPFTAAGIADVLDGQGMAPGGAGCIRLAWTHRDRLLS